MKTKDSISKKEKQSAPHKKPTADEGHGQAGRFGSDGDWGKHQGISPDRSSPNVSEKDTRSGRES